ncbi:MAG: caspase family protein [Ignavibacteria bacterium]|nr:caspase family protein [Ignavibacteria bacterium]
MKKTMLLFVISSLFVSLVAQITGTTQTGSLVAKKQTPPKITIVEPKFLDAKDYVHHEGTITIRGNAESEVGISEILINSQKATLLSSGMFFGNVILGDGLNEITVIAKDVNGLTSKSIVKVMCKTDAYPPVIAILEPAVSRGLKIIKKSEVVSIKGNAYDESGIYEITVNERRALVQPNGDFSINMNLAMGDNMLIVKALDTKFNSAIDTFYITRQSEELVTVGKYYALVIGIDNYKGDWPKLNNAVNDAKTVSEVLLKDYRFDEIITLYNEEASRDNIIQKLEALASKTAKDDNVLVYYSGHGEFNQQYNRGYWVPANATTKSTSGYISNPDLQTYLNGIRSRHTLLISDACFSGDILRGRTEEVPFENSDRYFKEVYRRASRCALTSGGNEPVMDGGRDGHSVFTYYLLKSLRENESQYLTAGQLFNELQIPVANNSEQTPIFQPIKNIGDEGGQFIFVKRK